MFESRVGDLKLNRMVYWHSGFAWRFEEYWLSIFYESGPVLKGDLHKQTSRIQALMGLEVALSFLEENTITPYDSITPIYFTYKNARWPIEIFLFRKQTPKLYVAINLHHSPSPRHFLSMQFSVISRDSFYTEDASTAVSLSLFLLLYDTKLSIREGSEHGRRSKIDIARERMGRMSMRA